MSDKQRKLYDERVKEMVLIPKSLYEKFKEVDVDKKENALVNKEFGDDIETEKEQSGTKFSSYENVYKDSLPVDNLSQSEVSPSRGNIYDILLKNKLKVISELSPNVENIRYFDNVRWQKISQLLTEKQVNKLISAQSSSFDKTQFDKLFSKSKVLRNIFYKMHFDSNYSSAVNDKKDMDNDFQASFSSKKQPTENDEQLPALRTKEVEQNKPITENSMTSIKEKEAVDKLPVKKED